MNLFNKLEGEDGSFKFDSNNRLVLGQTPIIDLVSKFLKQNNSIEYIDEENESEIKLKNGNELIPDVSNLSTPLFIYSKKKLISNFLAYKSAFNELITDPYHLETVISYSMKANYNPTILKVFYELGSWCSLGKCLYLILN
jgi:hypothetical protein